MAGAQNKEASRGEPVISLEEQNLVEFPLCYLADNPPSELKTLTFEDSIFDESTNRKVERKVIITAADAFGLPNWFDQDVLLALMVLTHRANGFKDRRVQFSIYEVNNLLLGNREKGGRDFARIGLALDRWCGTTIKYQNAWRKNERWASETFHIIDRVKLTKSRDYDPEEEQVFEWSSVVIESISQQNTKRFDWEFYRSLKNPTAKRLYRFLDKRFWHKRKLDFAGVDFAINKVGVAKDQPAYRYKERLIAGSRELIERGFIKEPRFEKEGKGRFRVYFEKASYSGAKKPKREPTPLETELAKRGVKNGEQLIAKHGEVLVREQIENFDDRIRAGEELSAGWLGSSIARGGYGFRKGFKSKAEVEAERAAKSEAARAEKAEKEKTERVKAQRAAALEAAIDDYLSKLGDSREQFEQEAIDAHAMAGTWLKDDSDGLFRKSIIRNHVKSIIMPKKKGNSPHQQA